MKRREYNKIKGYTQEQQRKGYERYLAGTDELFPLSYEEYLEKDIIIKEGDNA